MDTLGMNFNDLVRDLNRRFEACGISTCEWEDGYTSDDVEEVLMYLQLCLRAIKIEGDVVMVWDRLDENGKYPIGDSEVWILYKRSDGYKGTPISTPFISTYGIEDILMDLIKFSEGTLELKPITFKRISQFNMILNH
ncbi:hypothetical protein [Paenibacillus periandrae]|uniref:hypothetical protein n=1 Tax=Paenibacillus periandrae TaxID=1761741 RepID=UPI001F0960ED|nr:hypothetical protein [Paenibacillus periandrae]